MRVMVRVLERQIADLGTRLKVARLVRRGLVVGRDVVFMRGVHIDPSHCGHIRIGDEVTLARGVTILAHDASTKRALGWTRLGKVEIGNRVFIGTGAIILPGVRIGDEAVVGAGSVVTRDIPERAVAAGVPARVLSSVDEWIEKKRLELARGPRFTREHPFAGGVAADGWSEMNQRMREGFGYIA